MKKDLSTVPTSMASILIAASEQLNALSTKAEIENFVSKLFEENNLDTPASKRLLLNIKKSNSYASALQTVYNSVLAGANLETIKL